MISRLHAWVAIVAAALALFALVRLESERGSIEIQSLRFGETPVTVYRGQSSDGALVLVSHGFAGSRQMMEAISMTLARAGHSVVSFDYLGHGRHPRALSPAIDRLTGTTEDLVQQTLDVAAQAQALTGKDRIALVGHSMATDVVIRAAERLPGVEAVVAISMYSEAVTPDHPARLLIVSGAHEQRLRAVALDAMEQIGPRAEEQTVTQGIVARRAVAAPWVGHVGVLWSGVTSSEIADWLGTPVMPVQTGPWIAALLGAIVVFFWPVAARLPRAAPQPSPRLRTAVLASVVPAPLAVLAAMTGLGALGLSGFGALALCFGVWGAAALAILRPTLRPSGLAAIAGLVLIVWGLGAFAFALDRYGAAFVPTGPRLALMVLLLPAMLLFALADRVMVEGRHPVLRPFLRLPFLIALFCGMILDPDGMGMLFTVLPVLVLFQIVYGTMAAWASGRAGPLGPGLASGLILAWSVAASTPLFTL